MIPIAKPLVGSEELSAIQKALESGYLTGGPMVDAFEKSLAEYGQFKHAVAVSSGTAALHVAMAALEIKPENEVIVPNFTFIATANAARYVGATPVFADVEPNFFTLDPVSFEAAITPKTKAVIPVSLYGQAYDVEAIQKIAKAHDVTVISDNAQSIGAKYAGSGNFGESLQIQSFYPTKNMTTGEGGAILTNSDQLAEQCRLWRNIGQKKPYEYVCAGFNYRMPSINAAMGTAQLQKLPGFTRARQKNAGLLNELLLGVSQVQIPLVRKNAIHVFNQYTILAEKRDALWAHLKQKGIGANVYYPQPLHALSTFNEKNSNYVSASRLAHKTPVTEQLCKSVLSLPIHPSVTYNQIHEIADAVKSFFI